MEPVTTGQIYWGAVPFVIIQCIMVALVILFPRMVMHYKSSGTTIDPAAVQQKLDSPIPGLDAPAEDSRPSRSTSASRRRFSRPLRPTALRRRGLAKGKAPETSGAFLASLNRPIRGRGRGS